MPLKGSREGLACSGVKQEADCCSHCEDLGFVSNIEDDLQVLKGFCELEHKKKLCLPYSPQERFSFL